MTTKTKKAKTKKTKGNSRTLPTITAEINALERRSIFALGDLMIEAREKCGGHGRWMAYQRDELSDWSADTVARYIKVAALGTKFRKLRNLRLPTTTLYALADLDEEDQQSAILELAKHANRKKLKSAACGRYIAIGIERQNHGDHPDATLAAVHYNPDAADALLAANPETEEAALAIIEAAGGVSRLEIGSNDGDDAAANGDDDDIERILSGPPPVLPPPAEPPPAPNVEPTLTPWAGHQEFAAAVETLMSLRTKPLKRFADACDPAKLHIAAEFLLDVARASEPAPIAALPAPAAPPIAPALVSEAIRSEPATAPALRAPAADTESGDDLTYTATTATETFTITGYGTHFSVNRRLPGGADKHVGSFKTFVNAKAEVDRLVECTRNEAAG